MLSVVAKELRVDAVSWHIAQLVDGALSREMDGVVFVDEDGA